LQWKHGAVAEEILVSSESLPASAKSGGANEEVDRRSSNASCAALIVQSSGFFVVGEV
jgi:hypothetical protein